MQVWLKTERLCIHFDARKVAFSKWPVTFSRFRGALIEAAMEHFKESKCIFISPELSGNNIKAKSSRMFEEVKKILIEKGKLFIQDSFKNDIELDELTLSTIKIDNDVFMALEQDEYDTEILASDSDNSYDELDFWDGWLVEEWDTSDVEFWLEMQGLAQFKKGFKEQKIDGLCLMEGLSDEELMSCDVKTVGDKRKVKRKISELLDKVIVKVPRLTRTGIKPMALSSADKEDLNRRKRQVHKKVITKFPGNKIPIIRGNPKAQQQFDEVLKECEGLIRKEIGYDEVALKKHVKAIMDERRRMVKEGYDYCKGTSTETEDSEDVKTDTCTSGREDDNSNKSTIVGHHRKIGSNDSCSTSPAKESENSDDSVSDDDMVALPDGATSVPLSTAETIMLTYFEKGYTKELKKDIHLLPMCREFNLKGIKGKDKNDLLMILSKELILRKKVSLKEDADFYCLHRDSISINRDNFKRG